jgi:hypothetical protein
MSNDGTPTPAPGETPQLQALDVPKPGKTASTVSSSKRCFALALGVAVLLCIAGVVACLLGLSVGQVLYVFGFALGAATLAIVAFAFAAGASFLLVLSTVRSVAIVPRTLFFRARLRLSDLILIVALLGNAEGLLFAYVYTHLSWAAPLCAALLALWILGGAAWGMWVATVLDLKKVWNRWRLILLGLAAPLTLPALAFGFCSVFHAFTRPQSVGSASLQLLLGVISLFMAFRVGRLAFRLHEAAVQCGNEEKAKQRTAQP